MKVLAFFAGLLLTSAAFAQVIYLPVQYQYGQQHKYYYGGNDPLIFARAERESALLAWRSVKRPLPRVYSDLLPFTNAYLYGFRASDAYNQAYQSVPRYFVKRDLLATAVEVDGALIVPPTPPRSLPVTPYASTAPAPTPAKKGVILIIPRKQPREVKDARPVMFVSAGQ